MPKIVKKCGKIALVFGLILVLVAMYLAIPMVQAFSITSRDLRISDSRPGVTAVIYDFRGNHSTTLVRCLRLRICTTASGTCTVPAGLATTAAARDDINWSGWTPASWTGSFTINGDIRYTFATGQAGGTGFSFSTSGITNPTAAGTYFGWVDTYSDTGCTTVVDSGVTAVAVIAGVTVTVAVAETLSVTVAGVTDTGCVQGTGIAVGTTATAVPFGTVSPDTFYRGCQDLTVATNAPNGFVLTTQEQTNLRSGTTNILDTTCDGGACSEVAQDDWTVATANQGYGHSCFNITGTPCNTVYTAAAAACGAVPCYRQFACRGTGDECDPGTGGETAQMFMSSTGPANVTGRILHRISVAPVQPALSYSGIIVYIATPTY